MNISTFSRVLRRKCCHDKDKTLLTLNVAFFIFCALFTKGDNCATCNSSHVCTSYIYIRSTYVGWMAKHIALVCTRGGRRHPAARVVSNAEQPMMSAATLANSPGKVDVEGLVEGCPVEVGTFRIVSPEKSMSSASSEVASLRLKRSASSFILQLTAAVQRKLRLALRAEFVGFEPSVNSARAPFVLQPMCVSELYIAAFVPRTWLPRLCYCKKG